MFSVTVGTQMNTRRVEMASRTAKILSPKGRTNSLEMEREYFEKCQAMSITKAINSSETPVKEKHVRRILIGTFKDENSSLFWTIVRKLPLQENPIVCWKFCHVLHKLLREGHKKSLSDAYPFRSMLKDLGKMWGLLKEGYGKLIQNYCTLLLSKIDFHARNSKFPGNLFVTDDELDNIGERDVNVFFQLSCEIFDYLEDILSLQTAVFGSLDMSRANSMTNAGQCRLAPLIPCIQDSSQLYDFSVKVLFKLHAVLPSGTLDGHRNRFYHQFKILKQFYLNSSNLQYFRNLIQVPLLPEISPNFLHASDLHSHVTPVVVLPNHPESPDGSESINMLVDLSIPCNLSEQFSEDTQSEFSVSASENGSHSTVLSEKNRIISHLMSKIDDLEMDIQQLKVDDGRTIDTLKRKILEMEENFGEQSRRLKCLEVDKDNCSKELEECRIELIRHQKGTDSQTELTKANEKYIKMRDIYNKLRSEHIELLRSKADVDKNIAALKYELEELRKRKEEMETEIHAFQMNETNKEDLSVKLEELQEKYISLESLNKKFLSEMALLQQEKQSVDSKLKEATATVVTLNGSVKAKDELLLQLSTKDWFYVDIILRELRSLCSRVLTEDEMAVISASVVCTPEYFFSQNDALKNSVEHFIGLSASLRDGTPNFEELVTLLLTYFHQLFSVFNCGKVVYQTLPNIEIGQDLMNRCKELMSSSLTLTEDLLNRKDIKSVLTSIEKKLNEILSLKTIVLPEVSINESKNLEDLLLSELGDMDKAIQEAASKIEEMMRNAKRQDTGMKLEVNGKILDACTGLMKAILELVRNAKELQKEIVSRGKGMVNSKEFYQRNHRWTEGLISAAKVVALAAKLLVDAADKVVAGKAKFEELMVASQEIAAATAQLVVASRVKAEKSSEKMTNLSQSSKLVTEATGFVVATAKSCAQLIEETDTLDFSKLTLHQAKRLEMESQVRVIELETQLTKERMRLSGLRKRHYHLGSLSENLG